MASCNPIDDKRGTVDYRTKVAGVLFKRATLTTIDRIKGN
jgi:carbon-monoxide dehydrogenase medium subunit